MLSPHPSRRRKAHCLSLFYPVPQRNWQLLLVLVGEVFYNWDMVEKYNFSGHTLRHVHRNAILSATLSSWGMKLNIQPFQTELHFLECQHYTALVKTLYLEKIICDLEENETQDALFGCPRLSEWRFLHHLNQLFLWMWCWANIPRNGDMFLSPSPRVWSKHLSTAQMWQSVSYLSQTFV